MPGRGDRTQDRVSLAGRDRWPGPRSCRRDRAERALPVAAGAAADRHSAPARPGSARDRRRARTKPVNHQPRAAPQHPPPRPRPVRRRPGPRPGSTASPPAPPHPHRHRRAAASGDPVQVGAGVEPGADRRPPTPGLPRPAGLARLSRDDLPGALPRREGWAEPVVDPPAAHGPATAKATPPPMPARSGSSHPPD
jgi:hypothetical protein